MGPEEATRDVSGERFADFLSGHFLLPEASLAELSGARGRSDFRSSLVERVEAAWETPVSSLLCRQVRVLVGQKFGLEWLARPAALFVILHPQVECEYFPGDLTIAALRALREIDGFAPVETSALIQADYNWLDDVFAEDEEGLWQEACAILDAVRKARKL